MFAFLRSDSRGSEQSSLTAHTVTLPDAAPPASIDNSPATPRIALASKRCRDCPDGPDGLLDAFAPIKRARLEPQTSCQVPPPAADFDAFSTHLDDARDIIRHQFGLEVLLKHSELRLINQELAKCQVALEQLRRCHLIPYPSTCPTPHQMLDISSGKGPALANPSGEPIPRWAPPFGVVEGPYARHYAKWLIPDPSFDRAQPQENFLPSHSRARGSVSEGRTTRNSFAEPSPASKGRRSTAGQKLQALSSGYPQAKDKAGPCILKRADGKTVKLVCLDCNRENFSSTQGFINHCRIAHRRDFKSHEEAAVQSGHAIDVADAGPAVADEKPPAHSASSASSALVHPLARHDMTEQQAYAALSSRISASLKLYHAGRLSAGGIDDAPETPHLSRLMQARNFTGSLRELVVDAKTKVSLEAMTPDDESDDAESPTCALGVARGAPQARMPVVMRVPARSGKSPAPTVIPGGRPASSKGRLRDMPLVSPAGGVVMSKHAPNAVSSDEEMDMDEANLSPNTLISNNAPSLVSDDGEYDDSDEGSSVSGASDHLDGTPMSDVAEITLDDDHEPRALRRGSSGVPGPVKLRRDDAKHVTLVSPVKNNTKQRRPRRV
ncbi:Spindle poly body spacer protein [Hirsutella rhossiliensis]|uniref:Spindle poly body spacer protein n=1 Tax=Hirsutella rhossiliensis TaxID=111463 RepID=A0A9P8SEF5_9HYPO|nr:Spindle poly body spacer protein [Hirsutella rhossiliensis]KAH0958340.1 Spindle poly body spacer protein [Hirsutella rhossiliensis]